jgi:DNA-binding NarL/FixJ family response regulator
MHHKIRIVVVDDHPVFRQGLRDVLMAEDDLDVIGEASDGEQALQLVRELLPDVVIMDVNIPGLNGLQVVHHLQQERISSYVLMLTAYDDAEQVFLAIRYGASGYFPKEVTPHKLIQAIRHISQGYSVIGDQVMDESQLAAWLLGATERFGGEGPGRLEEPMPSLSPREMEVLQLITHGLPNKIIAQRLDISHQTVKNHITSILHKLDVGDRTQAALYALRRGWVRLQDTQAVHTPGEIDTPGDA